MFRKAGQAGKHSIYLGQSKISFSYYFHRSTKRTERGMKNAVQDTGMQHIYIFYDSQDITPYKSDVEGSVYISYR